MMASNNCYQQQEYNRQHFLQANQTPGGSRPEPSVTELDPRTGQPKMQILRVGMDDVSDDSIDYSISDYDCLTPYTQMTEDQLEQYKKWSECQFRKTSESEYACDGTLVPIYTEEIVPKITGFVNDGTGETLEFESDTNMHQENATKQQQRKVKERCEAHTRPQSSNITIKNGHLTINEPGDTIMTVADFNQLCRKVVIEKYDTTCNEQLEDTTIGVMKSNVCVAPSEKSIVTRKTNSKSAKINNSPVIPKGVKILQSKTSNQSLRNDSPKVLTTRKDAPNNSSVIDAPTFDAPEFNALKFDAPIIDAPKFDAPKIDAPKTKRSFRHMPIKEMSRKQYRSFCWLTGKRYKHRKVTIAPVPRENETRKEVETFWFGSVFVKIFEHSPLCDIATNVERMRKILQAASVLLSKSADTTTDRKFWQACGYTDNTLKQYVDSNVRERLWATIYQLERSQTRLTC